MRSLSEIVEHSVAQPRFSALLMSLFAGLALLLSAIGLYGVISYFVSQRTHEIGLRVALGARRDDVAKLVIRQGLSLTVIGIAIGLMAAFGATRFLSSMLYGVRSTDLTVFVAVSVFLLTVCLLACAVPAFRATKVDAMVALRYE
jgi:putative ABC transport system permease protein